MLMSCSPIKLMPMPYLPFLRQRETLTQSFNELLLRRHRLTDELAGYLLSQTAISSKVDSRDALTQAYILELLELNRFARLSITKQNSAFKTVQRDLTKKLAFLLVNANRNQSLRSDKRFQSIFRDLVAIQRDLRTQRNAEQKSRLFRLSFFG